MRKTTAKARASKKSAKPASRKKTPAARRKAAEPDASPIALIQLLPEALAPLERATSAVAEIARGLEHAHAQLQGVVFHLPRPSEYEPLAEALTTATQRLETVANRIAAQPASAAPPAGAEPPLSPRLLAMRLERVGHAIESARDAIRDALRSLPPSEHYAPVARQLKELASVSPSLMEWMREVPRLTTPLTASVDALSTAADELDGAFVDVALTQRDLGACETVD
jgi:hypothetical protein